MRPFSVRARSLLVVLGLLGLGLAACGAPTDGKPREIEGSDIPYNLLEEPSAAPSRPASDAASGPRLYWVDGRDRLVARAPSHYCTKGLGGLTRTILGQLAEGPSEPDLSAGLGTALPPESWLSLVEIDGRTARLRITNEETVTTSRVVLATAQAVLTVTSIPGVDQVEVEFDGEPLQMPLPSGDLATGPLRYSDYAGMLRQPRSEPKQNNAGPEVLCPS
ncbi:MAG: GerMN domain-containing protein [Nocardioides sp.]|uniref:GerMN domain-containing protein n=1 Tax=Nocardioides sp. TaxID=35761 RepID=UPI003D6AC563